MVFVCSTVNLLGILQHCELVYFLWGIVLYKSYYYYLCVICLCCCVIQTHVTSAMLRYEAGRLLRFLGFDKIPEFPVKYISMAYTLSLDLPGKRGMSESAPCPSSLLPSSFIVIRLSSYT